MFFAGKSHQGLRITNRKREILSLVAQGFSSKRIGTRLGISPSTVNQHLEVLQLKLGAHNRTHLIVLAIQFGIIDIRVQAGTKKERETGVTLAGGLTEAMLLGILGRNPGSGNGRSGKRKRTPLGSTRNSLKVGGESC